MFVMLSAALDRPCQIPGPDALTRASKDLRRYPTGGVPCQR